MRLVTSARLRAVGFLLLEAASVGALIYRHVAKDPQLAASVRGLAKKVRAL